MARPATEPAPAPGAPAGAAMGRALRALRSRRMSSTPRMLAAGAGLALTALAFASGALGSSAPADAGTFLARSAPSLAAAPTAPSPVASTVASAAPSAAPSVAASAAAPLALAGAGTSSTGSGASASAAPTDDVALLGAAGAGFDPLDLASKGAIVVALLYVTLRVLRRMQGGTTRAGGRIQVLESRPLAAKASLHLVEVGDRRLVVGLTPAGMVSLAELGADDLPELDPSAEPASRSLPATGAPGLAGVAAALRGGASFGATLDGALGALRTGLGTARSRIGSAR